MGRRALAVCRARARGIRVREQPLRRTLTRVGTRAPADARTVGDRAREARRANELVLRSRPHSRCAGVRASNRLFGQARLLYVACMAIGLQPGRQATAVTAENRAPSHAVATSGLWHAYTAAFAAACVMIGVYWDISWHMSIGRDTFWTPAHLLIQAGGLIAGLSSGYIALKTTFNGSAAERAASVSFWGFRAPLGAWMCVWGCG